MKSILSTTLALALLFTGTSLMKAEPNPGDDEEEPGSELPADDWGFEVNISKDFKVEDGKVRKFIKDFYRKLENEYKKSKPVPITTLASFGYKMQAFSKHPEIEEETKIYKSWFKDLGDTTIAMSNAKRNTFLAKNNKEQEVYKKSQIQYQKLFVKCVELIKNPKKIKKKGS